jgi:hypothetical protein
MSIATGVMSDLTLERRVKRRLSFCFKKVVAERVGFEPTNTREDVTEFPVQRLRPLGHLSGLEGLRSLSPFDTGVPHRLLHCRAMRLGERRQRETDPALDESHVLQRPLDRNRIRLDE